MPESVSILLLIVLVLHLLFSYLLPPVMNPPHPTVADRFWIAVLVIVLVLVLWLVPLHLPTLHLS